MWQKIKNIIIPHWQVKILAMIIAVGVWFYANSRLKDDVVLRLPFNVILPENHSLIYQSHSYVQVRFTGPQYLIRKRQEEAGQNYLNFNLQLEQEDIENGWTELDIQAEYLNIPETDLRMMNVFIVEPLAVKLFSSRVGTRTLPVEANLSGNPPPGYQVEDVDVTPSEVSVTGPDVVLDNIDAVSTNTLSISDLSRSDRFDLKLKNVKDLVLNDDVKVSLPFDTALSHVTVYISIAEEVDKQEMKNIPIKFLSPIGFPYKIEFEEAMVDVVFKGKTTILEELSSGDIQAYVDLTGLEDEEISTGATAPYKQDVVVTLRPGIDLEIDSITPDQITVLLTNE